MSLRRCSLILALAALPTVAVAGLTQTLIDTLPEQPSSAYPPNLPGWIAQAKTRPGANPGSKLQTGSVMIAPVVLNWAPENLQGRGFPPWWITGESTGGVQVTTNEIHRKVVDAFRSRNWGFYTPAWLRERGASLDGVGGKPISVNGRSYGGGSIAGYPYVSEKLRQWTRGDFLRLHSQYPGPQSVALIQLNTIWIYNGHSRMNGEAIVNYDVYTSGEVQLCDAARCVSAKIGPDNALKSTLPVPADATENDSRRLANNTFAIGLASDYFSGVAVALIENLLDAPAVAVAPIAAPVSGVAGFTLAAPASLKTGERLLSKDGRFEVAMQADGNLVLYRTGDRRALWSSGTNGKGAAVATMQEDGNLVLYKADGAPVWATDTWKKGAVRAVMQDDGNFVLYKADGTPVWSSGTCCY